MSEEIDYLKLMKSLAEKRAKYEAGLVDGSLALICDCYCRSKGVLRVQRKNGQVGECFMCEKAFDGRPSVGVKDGRFCIGRLHQKNANAVRKAIVDGKSCTVRIVKTSDVRWADERGRDLVEVIVDEKKN